MRRSRKLVSILLTMAMLATLLVPLASPALASDMYSCTNPKTVTDDTDNQALGSILVEVPQGVLAAGDSFDVDLASDFDIMDVSGAAGYVLGTDYDVDPNGDGTNDATIPVVATVPAQFSGNTNILDPLDVDVVVNDANSVTVSLNGVTNASNDAAYIRIYFNLMDVASGAEGDITATITGFGGFADGSVVIGKVTGGTATVSIADTTNIAGDSTIENITILESTPGALTVDDESVNLVLPNGFTWDAGSVATASGGFGAGAVGAAPTGAGTDTLSVDVNAISAGSKGKIVLSGLAVSVDEGDADFGDVVVKIKGESKDDISPTSIIVAKYGELGEKVTADDPETVISGKYSQEIADITVTENAVGSLVNGRSITFELPTDCKWTAVDSSSTDSGVDLDFAGFIGSDYNKIKYVVSGAPSSDAAEIELTGFEIAVDPGFTGDVKVKTAGTQGIKDEVTVAKAVANVTATVATKSEVKIGMQSQAIADIVITEGDAEAIQQDRDLIVELPDGVEFAAVPSVKVTTGDLDIDESGVKRAESDTQLVIPIDSDSNDASTITLSNVKLTVDRTVSEGDIVAKIKGDAVVQVNDLEAIDSDFDDDDAPATPTVFSIDVDGTGEDFIDLDADASGDLEEGFFPNSTTAAKVTVANVATPAPGEFAANASFVIGSTTYKLNGVDATMDVAPYIKDGRTYMPIRYVAYALGVTDSNILWDGATGKVTLIKGDKVVQLTIGSNVMMVNGASITMDAAPEIVSSRTMLPIRHVAEVLGATVGWDAATQTVTIN